MLSNKLRVSTSSTSSPLIMASNSNASTSTQSSDFSKNTLDNLLSQIDADVASVVTSLESSSFSPSSYCTCVANASTISSLDFVYPPPPPCPVHKMTSLQDYYTVPRLSTDSVASETSSIISTASSSNGHRFTIHPLGPQAAILHSINLLSTDYLPNSENVLRSLNLSPETIFGRPSPKMARNK